MTILAIKSIPLQRETNNAWKTVPGLFFASRERDPVSIARHVQRHRYEAVINLGVVDLDLDKHDIKLFNHRDTIRAISTPKALRRTLNDQLPAYTHNGPHWHKSPGFGGDGKHYYKDIQTACVGYNGDTQRHIGGTEYRIVTVGHSIVQASRKGERRTLRNGRNHFAYTWIGVKGIKADGFIPLIKRSLEDIPGAESSILGWDVLYDGQKPYVIEINTCPGVNQATANRIVTKVRELL